MKKIILIPLVLAAALLLAACRAEPPTTAYPEVEAPAAPIGTPVPAATPAPPPEEPEASPQPAASPVLDAAVIPVRTGVREDGTFDAGTLFIGDSLTYGLLTKCLIPNEWIGDAQYMTICGMAMQGFFGEIKLNNATLAAYGCLYSPAFQDLNLGDAVAVAGESVTSIYFMMGTNLSSKASVEVYEGILDHLLSCCPNAAIFMQTIPYSRSGLSDYTYVNENIASVVAAYQERGCPVYLIDTFAAIGTDCNTTDGLHITEKGQCRWYEKLLENDRALNGASPRD
ncbi:MAG: hypothetical protein ACI4PC_08985 [Oscillospiraceae bacterium]